MNGCQITMDKLQGGQYDMWLCCFRAPVLLLMKNVFGSNKDSIDNEYKIQSLLLLKCFIESMIAQRETADFTERFLAGKGKVELNRGWLNTILVAITQIREENNTYWPISVCICLNLNLS